MMKQDVADKNESKVINPELVSFMNDLVGISEKIKVDGELKVNVYEKKMNSANYHGSI